MYKLCQFGINFIPFVHKHREFQNAVEETKTICKSLVFITQKICKGSNSRCDTDVYCQLLCNWVDFIKVTSFFVEGMWPLDLPSCFIFHCKGSLSSKTEERLVWRPHWSIHPSDLGWVTYSLTDTLEVLYEIFSKTCHARIYFMKMGSVTVIC